ncbi:tyrosine-type recombinase/integrase [Methanoculleus sp. 7T]|uniref:tyrosine-type recombinase/integrase n=1 Tax=Methanoculleus sp. 7T TaxID=2937282 RepID=UPI0020C0E301|nr:tyrosine-type recombinase/integrase [Methanoculleus sp. 7T]MCK8519493.1 site-specific integrase [Methanoculleus sp. 7T]
MENERFHHSAEEFFGFIEKSLAAAEEEERITPEDAGLIREYVAESSSKLSPGRQFKTVYTLIASRRYLPPFTETKKADLLAGINRMRYAKKDDGTPYAKNTIADYVRFTKRFFLWLAKREYIDIPASIIKEIKNPQYNTQTKTEDNILTGEEVSRLIDAAKSIKYKALLGVMYEAGLRSGEVASLKWKDVTFHEWGAKVRTSEKTGRLRTIPIITYREYLAKWKSSYPGDPTGDNFVFLTSRGEPMQYRGLAKAVHNFAKAAGIKKKITLHSFRHSRITHALRGGMQETLAKKAFWGNQSTQMIACYSHLVDEDVDNAFAALAGVELPGSDQASESPEPVQCPTCHLVMPPGSQFCARCGLALSQKSRNDLDGALAELQSLLVQDPVRAIEAIRLIRENRSPTPPAPTTAP